MQYLRCRNTCAETLQFIGTDRGQLYINRYCTSPTDGPEIPLSQSMSVEFWSFNEFTVLLIIVPQECSLSRSSLLWQRELYGSNPLKTWYLDVANDGGEGAYHPSLTNGGAACEQGATA